MNRIALAGILVAASAMRAATAERGQLDASPSLFAVMAAINAAGYDADLASTNNSPLRAAIRSDLAAKSIPSLKALKEFYAAHHAADATAELSQYISLALSVDGPPAFKIKTRGADVPPDVLPLEGFAPLLSAFYREANLEDLWKRSQPTYEQAIERYHEPVAAAVLQVNAYLRNETSGTSGSWFQIFVDLLGAPNQIQTRSYAYEYFVVITPSAEPRINDVRHAYLHYLLDPLATRHQEVIMRKAALADHAQRSPTLDQSFKSDYLLLTTESLIKAVESRLDRKPESANEAMREGYILTAYFMEQLQAYEKQEQAMRFFYPEMIKAIDLRREEARLSQPEFVSQLPARPAKVAPAPPPPEPKGVYKTLDDAEQLYRDRSLEPARQLFLKALQETDEQPLHAKAYYGLARIAALEKNPELAESMFQKTLESRPEPQIQAWALVYLGRLADAAGDRQEATKHYQEALAVPGASEAARQAAAQGTQQSYRK